MSSNCEEDMVIIYSNWEDIVIYSNWEADIVIIYLNWEDIVIYSNWEADMVIIYCGWFLSALKHLCCSQMLCHTFIDTPLLFHTRSEFYISPLPPSSIELGIGMLIQYISYYRYFESIHDTYHNILGNIKYASNVKCAICYFCERSFLCIDMIV